jgi:type IV pilus assembly protein PilO
MPELGETRQKLKIALGVLVVLDVVAAAVLLSPLVGSAKSRDQQLTELGTEIQAKTRQVQPLRGLDKKIPMARQQIDDFYSNRLTSEDSEISADLEKLASTSGVKINGVKYAQDERGDTTNDLPQRAEAAGLHRILLEADLSGDYLQLMRFVNGLERNRLFFIVDSVQLGGEQGGTVKLQMRLETYRRTT